MNSLAGPVFVENATESLVSRIGSQRYCSDISLYSCSVEDAVLFGERAVVSPEGLLITDNRALPGTSIFDEGMRKFEFMDAQPVDGGLVSAMVSSPTFDLDMEAVLLSSWEHWNYGAVLLREIPKLLTVKALGLGHLPVVAPDKKWQKDLLEIFGLKDIITHDRMASYRFAKLHVISQRCPDFVLDEETHTAFEELAREQSSRGDMELLYVSRLSQGLKKPEYRRCLNEEDLIDRLQKLGFCIFEPENYKLSKQIATFRSAKLVVGPSGAGLFNTVFCNTGTPVISLEPLPNWIEQHANIFAGKGLQYGFITGGAVSSDPQPVQKSWLADIEATILRVEQALRNIKS